MKTLPAAIPTFKERSKQLSTQSLAFAYIYILQCCHFCLFGCLLFFNIGWESFNEAFRKISGELKSEQVTSTFLYLFMC